MRPTDRGIRLSDFVAWRRLCCGLWYANPVTGQVFLTRNGEEIKFQKTSRGGYLYTNTEYRGKCIKILKHRIIWIAAHGVPIDDLSMTIDHINGDKTDNRIENLQLLTSDENLWKGNRKLSGEQAREIRKLNTSGVPQDTLAKKYGVSPSVISRIVHRTAYREVKDDDE